MKKPSLKYVGDQSVRALLARYVCPIPFHAVRTRFLGNIATPKLDASPVQTIKRDVLQLSKSGKRAIGRVGRAPSHAATSNKLLMN